MSVKQTVDAMRAKDPILTDLFGAYIIAKREGDEATAQQVMLLIDLHKNS